MNESTQQSLDQLSSLFAKLEFKTYSGEEALSQIAEVLRDSGWLTYFQLTSPGDFVLGTENEMVEFGYERLLSHASQAKVSLLLNLVKLPDGRGALQAGVTYWQGKEVIYDGDMSESFNLDDGAQSLESKLFVPLFKELISAIQWGIERSVGIPADSAAPLRKVIAQKVLSPKKVPLVLAA